MDRPIVETAAGLTRDQIPQVVAGIQLFGRQTDRPERLVVETDRDRLSMVESLLRRIAALNGQPGWAFDATLDEAVGVWMITG